jgi:hypothetical protein
VARPLMEEDADVKARTIMAPHLCTACMRGDTELGHSPIDRGADMNSKEEMADTSARCM